MPLYEYQCRKCHCLMERIQRFSDPPLTVCPHCGGELEQLISAPAIQFKGSGWYATDYARKSSSSEKDGNGASPASEKSSGEGAGSSEKSSAGSEPAEKKK